jgi:hypothetical protein
MAIVAWVLVWVVGHHWLGPVTPSPQVLLAPAAVAIAVAVGLGAASFESDLPGYRFGWRQGATVLAAVAVAIGVLPVLLASANGRWDLPLTGYGEATAWMGAHSGPGDFRVLWLGDPRVLPGGGWQLAPGLAYSVSENGLGDATEIWSGSSPGAAAAIGRQVGLARRGSTVRLGGLLAPYAIRYVVVVDNLAPSIPGFQSPVGYAPPPDLNTALLSQLDLRQIIGQGGFEVFVDNAALPERAVLTRGTSPPSSLSTPDVAGATTASTSTTTTSTTTTTTTPVSSARSATVSPVGADQALEGWRPVLQAPPGATSVSGPVPVGTVVAAVAPARSWELVEPGGQVQRSQTAFGYAAAFDVPRPGVVTVRFRGSWGHGLSVTVEAVLWLVVIGLLVGRKSWWARLSGRAGRRRVRRARPVPSPAAGSGTGTGTDDDRGGGGGEATDREAPAGLASEGAPT